MATTSRQLAHFGRLVLMYLDFSQVQLPRGKVVDQCMIGSTSIHFYSLTSRLCMQRKLRTFHQSTRTSHWSTSRLLNRLVATKEFQYSTNEFYKSTTILNDSLLSQNLPIFHQLTYTILYSILALSFLCQHSRSELDFLFCPWPSQLSFLLLQSCNP